VKVVSQQVPPLTRDLIRAVKRKALELSTPPHRNRVAALQSGGSESSSGDSGSGASKGKSSGTGAAPFAHPGGYAGAGELGTLQWRLEQQAPLQAAARDSLLTVGARNCQSGVEGATIGFRDLLWNRLFFYQG
jgi:hypothetical protein